MSEVDVKEPEALGAREHAALEGNLVVPEDKLVHFGGAGKRALLNRDGAVVAKPHQGEAGACREAGSPDGGAAQRTAAANTAGEIMLLCGVRVCARARGRTLLNHGLFSFTGTP